MSHDTLASAPQAPPLDRPQVKNPLLTVDHLHTSFFTDEGEVRAVNDVSLVIARGKTLGLVGESGCGKSVTALSIMRLLSPPGRIVTGKITLHREERAIDLVTLPEAQMQQFRGAEISMIFQEPMTSLNPVFTVGNQIAEAIVRHQKLSPSEAWHRAIEMLQQVRIPEPERRVSEYPHQFSGGMRQRAMIAMALSCHPKLLIADEPSTALDVTIQAQILDLLRQLQQDVQMSILIITHDLGVIAEMADDVAVMYAAQVVELAPITPLFDEPLHPYTVGLFRSRPDLETSKAATLSTIPGMVPSPRCFPSGCTFHPRCAFRQAICQTEAPALRELQPGHWARCHFAGQLPFGRGERG